MRAALWLRRLSCLILASSAFTVNAQEVITIDVVGDVIGSGSVKHDLLRATTLVDATQLLFRADFAEAIEPASAHAPRSLYGYLDLDIDQNPNTGVHERFGQATTRPGVEYVLDLFSESQLKVDVLETVTFQAVGTAALSFQSNLLRITLPLALAGGDDGRIDWGLSVGTVVEANDQLLGTTVPEPAAIRLWTTGVLGLLAALLRKRLSG